jgi:hypothetical protein
MKWKQHITRKFTIKDTTMSKQKQFKHNLDKVKRIKNFNAKTNNESTLHEMFEQMFNSYKDIYKDNIITDLNKLK